MADKAFMCKNQHGTWYARFIIPKHLESHFQNKKEIRRSLQTDSKKLAIKRSRVFRVEFEKIADQLMSKKTDNTPERAKKIIDSLFAEEVTANDFSSNKPDASLNDGADRTYLMTHTDAFGNTTIIDYDNDVEKEVQAYKAIASIAQQTAITAPPVLDSETVAVYLGAYITHKTNPIKKGKKGFWADSTTEQKINKFGNFKAIFGEKLAANLTEKDMENYINFAYKLPSRFGGNGKSECGGKFKGITIEMIFNNTALLEKFNFSPRMLGTVQGDLKIIVAFLNWVAKRKHVVLQIPINTLSAEIAEIDYESTRRDFTPEELQTIFQNDNPAIENYVKGFSKPIDYWVPIIALYTGCRIMEICQLYTDDIKLVKALTSNTDHWCFDINDKFDKNLKYAKSGTREIPIHPNLINVGLLDYVAKRKANGELRLFDNPAEFKFQSKNFAAYSNDAGITDRDTTFHSFRHTFSGYLSFRHIDDSLLNALLGHQSKSFGKKTYDRKRKRDVGKLANEINSIDHGLTHYPFQGGA